MIVISETVVAKRVSPIKFSFCFWSVLLATCVTSTSLSAMQQSEARGATDQEVDSTRSVTPAPETAGKDCEGTEFKLSDYRGQVVLLYFWGDWCPPCRALNPKLNEIVADNAERPFVIVGVNSDRDPAVVQTLLRDEKISWRSFQDHDQKISGQWDVNGFPSLVLIDASGNIVESGNSMRDFKNLGNKIDELVLPLLDLGEEEREAQKDAAAEKRDRS